MAWLLPPEAATDYVCVNIAIPNTAQDKRNFLGSILSLAQWFNYERTGTNLGAQVADTWLTCLNGILIGACMEVRQSPTDSCILQLSEDGGETWVNWADITLCVNSEYVESLISETPSLQRLISSLQTTASITAETAEETSILETSFLQGQALCDNDNLYGMCLQLTKLLNTVSENLLDIFVAGLQQAGNLGDLIEAIPVVGELPLDDLLQLLQKVATQVNTAYQAAYDTQIEEDISCLFFCVAKDDCELTFEDARDVIRAQLSAPVTIADFASLVNDMIANNWFGDQAIWIFHLFILETIIYGGEILGLDVNRFAKTVATYLNDPNEDWETLCTDCGFVWESNFLVSENIWEPQPSAYGDFATWTDGVGYESVDTQTSGTVYSRICLIQTSEFTPCKITRVRLEYDIEIGTYDTVTQNAVQIVLKKSDNSLQAVQIQAQNVVNGYGIEFDWNNPNLDDVKQIWLMVRSSARSLANYSGVAKVATVRVEGNGENPFV